MLSILQHEATSKTNVNGKMIYTHELVDIFYGINGSTSYICEKLI